MVDEMKFEREPTYEGAATVAREKLAQLPFCGLSFRRYLTSVSAQVFDFAWVTKRGGRIFAK